MSRKKQILFYYTTTVTNRSLILFFRKYFKPYLDFIIIYSYIFTLRTIYRTQRLTLHNMYPTSNRIFEKELL